jgi:hypothetical protein
MRSEAWHLTGSLFALLPFEAARNTEVANLGVRDIQEASLSLVYKHQ